MRVHEIARIAGVDSRRVVRQAKALRIAVKGASSALTTDDATKVLKLIAHKMKHERREV